MRRSIGQRQFVRLVAPAGALAVVIGGAALGAQDKSASAPPPAATLAVPTAIQPVAVDPKNRKERRQLVLIADHVCDFGCAIRIGQQQLPPFAVAGAAALLDIPTGQYELTVNNNGRTANETLNVDSEPKMTIRTVKVPMPPPPPAAPKGGSIVVQLAEPGKVSLDSAPSVDVAKETTLNAPAGQHSLTIDTAAGRVATSVSVSDGGSSFVRIAAPVAPPAASSPIESLQWTPVTGGALEVGCVTGDANCFEDEKKVRSVTVPSFQMMTYEVTIGQFEDWLRRRPAGVGSYSRAAWSASMPLAELMTHPVVRVTWGEAADFCAAVQAHLPSEAEYEAAARQGRRNRIYSWDPENGEPEIFGKPLAPQAPQGPVQAGLRNDAAAKRLPGNFADESAKRRFPAWMIVPGYDDTFPYTAPVGKFRAVGGIFDLAGNVWEWTQESSFDDFSGKAADATKRVARGGSYTSPAVALRISYRTSFELEKRGDDLGFRCAK